MPPMYLSLIRIRFSSLILLVGIGCLPGCYGNAHVADGTAADSGSIVMRAIQGLGAPPPHPSETLEAQLSLRIFTAKNLNAGAGNKALALVVKIYHLRSKDRFGQAPFDDFLDSNKEQSDLGQDLINSREMLLLPDQRYLSVERMPLDTRYLGFVAQFRNPAALRWRFVYDVKRSKISGITLGIHACALSSTQGALLTELPDDARSLATVRCPTS